MEKLSQFAEVHVVLGNEACDLDSMVSSLVYAFTIYKVRSTINTDILKLTVEQNTKISCKQVLLDINYKSMQATTYHQVCLY